MRKDIRVRTENAKKFVQALIAAGFKARWHVGASAGFMGGCSDVAHCCPHPDAIVVDGYAHMGEEWSTIVTNASGNQAHKVFESVK